MGTYICAPFAHIFSRTRNNVKHVNLLNTKDVEIIYHFFIFKLREDRIIEHRILCV